MIAWDYRKTPHWNGEQSRPWYSFPLREVVKVGLAESPVRPGGLGLFSSAYCSAVAVATTEQG